MSFEEQYKALAESGKVKPDPEQEKPVEKNKSEDEKPDSSTQTADQS